MRLKKMILFLLVLYFTAGISFAFAQTPPTLTVEDSIKIAKDELTKANFDTSNHYIFSIILTNSSKGQFWYYTYRSYHPSQYREFFIKIYMDGTCDLSQAKAPRGSGY